MVESTVGTEACTGGEEEVEVLAHSKHCVDSRLNQRKKVDHRTHSSHIRDRDIPYCKDRHVKYCGEGVWCGTRVDEEDTVPDDGDGDDGFQNDDDTRAQIVPLRRMDTSFLQGAQKIGS